MTKNDKVMKKNEQRQKVEQQYTQQIKKSKTIQRKQFSLCARRISQLMKF